MICLKNRTFAVSQTTRDKYLNILKMLWFAWKIVLLQYRKQRHVRMLGTSFRCDLLEKSYFCSIANNRRNWLAIQLRVVICLKNRTFAVSQTTRDCLDAAALTLWFAWKIVLLQYRKQREWSEWFELVSCDLLEKSYFCSIANNT